MPFVLSRALTVILLAALVAVPGLSGGPTVSAAISDDSAYDDIYITRIALYDGAQLLWEWRSPGNYYSIAHVDRGSQFDRVLIEAHMGTSHLLNYRLYGDPSAHPYLYFDLSLTGVGAPQQLSAPYDNYDAEQEQVTVVMMIDEIDLGDDNEVKIIVHARLV